MPQQDSEEQHEVHFSSEDGVSPPRSSKLSKELRLCYTCGKPGHIARDCRSPKSESKGVRKDKTTMRQVTSQENKQLTPFDYLYSSSSDEGGVKQVRVQDRGSKPWCTQVQTQGVKAWGIMDSGADITIMGKDLFKTIATLHCLKKKDFKPPDKVPKTYDRQPFTLDGRMELEISFGDKTMTTTVYIKLDAHDELLLSVGVCRQLGIIRYHPDVQVWKERCHHLDKELTNSKECGGEEEVGDGVVADVVVPTVRVKLLQSVWVLPQHTAWVQVQVEGSSCSPEAPLAVEPGDQGGTDAVEVEPCLLSVQDEIASIPVTNHSGFTQRVEKGEELGTVMETAVVKSPS